ncbi:MAG TPA: acyl carrier protein [Thermoanaerobaculia bacterium]|nr:acyl carrier protein [Thermoanaerobaculia bacterium]
MSTESRETALAVLARVTGRARAEIAIEMSLVGDLGIDSPKALELLLELEEALGIEISDRDASGMDTVRDVIAFADRVA